MSERMPSTAMTLSLAYPR